MMEKFSLEFLNYKFDCECVKNLPPLHSKIQIAAYLSTELKIKEY